jgi:hypothetical protein
VRGFPYLSLCAGNCRCPSTAFGGPPPPLRRGGTSAAAADPPGEGDRRRRWRGRCEPQTWIESTFISTRSQKELLRINGITAGGKNLRTGFVHTSCPSRIIAAVLPAGNAPESFDSGEGSALPFHGRRSHGAGEAPSKGSPRDTTVPACWRSTQVGSAKAMVMSHRRRWRRSRKAERCRSRPRAAERAGTEIAGGARKSRHVF